MDGVKRRLGALPPGGVLRVVVRDPAARIDLPALAWLLGHEMAGERRLDERAYEFRIKVKGNPR